MKLIAFVALLLIVTAHAEPPATAAAYAKVIAAAHGGREKLRRVVKFAETYLLGGNTTKEKLPAELAPKAPEKAAHLLASMKLLHCLEPPAQRRKPAASWISRCYPSAHEHGSVLVLVRKSSAAIPSLRRLDHRPVMVMTALRAAC